ncbi:MAG: apolipoprotein N-acyltransferase [Desulfovibrio sp.]|nr:apolipoprotein N-acyltransferase [Desulfovibrio sp.]
MDYVLPPKTQSERVRVTVLLSLFGALALFLGAPNNLFSCPVLILFWPLSLVLNGLFSSSAREAFCRGLLTNIPGTLASLYWLALPIREVGLLPWPVAAGCAVLVCLALSALLALQSLTAFFFRRTSPLLLPFAMASSWLVLEEANALLAGFPWLPISGSLVAWPLLVQSAAWIGMYGTDFLWELTVFLLIPFLLRQKGGRPLAASSLLLAGFLLFLGFRSLAAHPLEVNPQDEKSFPVLFIEGNFDQNQKWVPSLQRETVQRYAYLTEKALNGRSGILVIWPETAMPFFLETKPLLAEAIRNVAMIHQIPLLFGAPGTDLGKKTPEGSSPVYNRALLLGPAGRLLGFYDKEHLVPFGEYTPSFLDLAFLKPLLQGVGVYTPGEMTAPLCAGNLSLGMLICYEAIFPWIAQKRVEEGANVLCDISNDGWFGTTPASRQHLYLTALRAVEQGRWMLRGTNSGISAVIDPQGRIVERGPLFTEGFLEGKAKISETRTLFHRFFPIFFYLVPALALLFLFTLLLVSVLRKKQ